MDLRSMLAPGDLRTKGRSEEVAALVAQDPSLTPDLLLCLEDPAPGVRMRAADALAKAQAAKPGIIGPHRQTLLAISLRAEQQEVRWHLAELLPQLSLEPNEHDQAWDLLRAWLRQDQSRIVQAACLQALTDLALKRPELRSSTLMLLRAGLTSQAPAVRARSRRMLQELERAVRLDQTDPG